MMYQVENHGNKTFSVVDYAHREGRAREQNAKPIRTRVLVQTSGDKLIVLRGSLIISRAEISRALITSGALK